MKKSLKIIFLIINRGLSLFLEILIVNCLLLNPILGYYFKAPTMRTPQKEPVIRQKLLLTLGTCK